MGVCDSTTNGNQEMNNPTQQNNLNNSGKYFSNETQANQDSPLLNNEVIGIHYGNENNEGYYWDSGIYILNFMFEYYGSIKEKLPYKRHKKEIKKINLDEIVLKKIMLI